MVYRFPLLVFGLLFLVSCYAQPLNQKKVFTHQDTLRGTNGPERTWWDVLHYDVNVTPDYATKSIKGKTTIQYKFSKPFNSKANGFGMMQIDLQQPLVVDSIKIHINYSISRTFVHADGRNDGDTREIDYFEHVPFTRDGNVVWANLKLTEAYTTGTNYGDSIIIYYHGTPREAKMPPWDGGWIWTKDKQGRPWMSVACQGLGASVWYPCKDYQGDEPDNGATLTINVPDTLMAVGNGRLISKSQIPNLKLTSYTWEVKSPINNYDLIPYIGKYVNWSETYNGEKGKLDLNYWVLDYELDKAKKQFEQVPQMLKAFEYWFGPYPFYEDGYKLVQAPHLGMEHQSAVAYGNQFKNGYLGRDLSGTGQGLKWDYIIVHESGHEWFGNNITTKDIADMWVHEGFTDYSETLFTEYYYGKEAADEYLQGLRRNIANDRPIIGYYGVNQEGSGDMYFKGANMIHTIRQIINNDSLFRDILRGLNKDFYHQTVTTKQIENYISQKSGKDFSKVFDQYLRTTQIPTLELKPSGENIAYKWSNCVPGFDMPIKLNNGVWIYATTQEKKIKMEITKFDDPQLSADKNFYINVKWIKPDTKR